MKNLLYIGNHFSGKDTNPSVIQTLGKQLEAEGFVMRYASSRRNKLLRLCDMVRCCFAYAKTTDAVLLDTYSTQNFYYAVAVSLCCKLLRLPYIPILHGGNLPKRLETHPFLSELVFRKAYALVSPSRYLKTVFEAHGYAPVTYIPNSIVLSHYPYAERSLPPVALLWVRAFSDLYHPALAVRVLKRLQDDGLEASLCMVGPDRDGSLAEVRALADQLGVQVRFTGKLSREAWTTLARDYTVFINTTRFDNMPVSVLEAMALGLPVVSTRVGGIPYLLEDGTDGLLVPPDDVEAFAGAVKQLAASPDLTTKLVQHARKKVEGFDWEVVKPKWIAVFRGDAQRNSDTQS